MMQNVAVPLASFPSSSLGTGLQQKLRFEAKNNLFKKMKHELPEQAHSQAGAWERDKREHKQ